MSRPLFDTRNFGRPIAPTRSRLLNRCLLSGTAPNGFERKADRPRVLEALLQAGADPNFAEKGATALQMAARNLQFILDTEPATSGDEESATSDAELVKEINVLRRHGARLDLFSAAAIGDEAEVGRLLKENRALAKSKSFDGFPALLEAVGRGQRNIVKQLLDAGCDVNIRNECEQYVDQCDTALLIAAWLGHDQIAKLLIERGADVNAPTADHKTTPLQFDSLLRPRSSREIAARKRREIRPMKAVRLKGTILASALLLVICVSAGGAAFADEPGVPDVGVPFDIKAFEAYSLPAEMNADSLYLVALPSLIKLNNTREAYARRQATEKSATSGSSGLGRSQRGCAKVARTQ